VREGTRLGIDVGTVRIGVSRSDRSGFLASPLETVARADDGSDVARIVALVAEHEAIEVVSGLPLALSGRRTASTEDAVGFAERLAVALAPAGVGVRLVDERLSTVTATSALRQSGKNAKKSRTVVDQSAAAVILQHALDAERSSGRPAGTPVQPPSA
jgi:putative Holliday junction resolvase